MLEEIVMLSMYPSEQSASKQCSSLIGIANPSPSATLIPSRQTSQVWFEKFICTLTLAQLPVAMP